MAIMRHDANPGKPPPERFSLTLETLPTDPRPGAIRMRAALKFLLRACGLKCVMITNTSGEDVAHD